MEPILTGGKGQLQWAHCGVGAKGWTVARPKVSRDKGRVSRVIGKWRGSLRNGNHLLYSHGRAAGFDLSHDCSML